MERCHLVLGPFWAISLAKSIAQIASNHQDRKVALESSADLSDILCRYSFFEIYYWETESEASEGIRRAIVRVYTAILRYVLAAVKIQDASVGVKIMYDLTG